jgi:hypothetical protein
VRSDVNELWQGLLGGSVRTAGLVMRQAPGTRRKIRAAVERLAEDHRADGELVIPVCVKIARGRSREYGGARHQLPRVLKAPLLEHRMRTVLGGLAPRLTRGDDD